MCSLACNYMLAAIYPLGRGTLAPPIAADLGPRRITAGLLHPYSPIPRKMHSSQVLIRYLQVFFPYCKNVEVDTSSQGMCSLSDYADNPILVQSKVNPIAFNGTYSLVSVYRIVTLIHAFPMLFSC